VDGFNSTNTCVPCPSSFWRSSRSGSYSADGTPACNALTGGAIGVIVALSFVAAISLVAAAVYCMRRGGAADEIDSKHAVKQIQQKPLLGAADAAAV
jgi:hypothetical protein